MPVQLPQLGGSRGVASWLGLCPGLRAARAEPAGPPDGPGCGETMEVPGPGGAESATAAACVREALERTSEAPV